MEPKNVQETENKVEKDFIIISAFYKKKFSCRELEFHNYSSKIIPFGLKGFPTFTSFTELLDFLIYKLIRKYDNH